MADLYEYSTPELVRLLGMRFKEYRMRCNLTQKEVAELTGLGLTTIHKFENGTAGNLSLATFLLLLKVVELISMWRGSRPGDWHAMPANRVGSGLALRSSHRQKYS